MSRSASSERPWGQGRLHPSAADQLQDFIVPLESDGEPHLVSLSHLFRSVFIAQLLALSLFDKKTAKMQILCQILVIRCNRRVAKNLFSGDFTSLTWYSNLLKPCYSSNFAISAPILGCIYLPESHFYNLIQPC